MSQRPLLRQLMWPMATGILVLGFSSCGNKQQEARSELSAKSFTFTVDEYIRAAREGNVTALKFFIEAGMAVDVTDAEGATALFRAAQAGRAEAVTFLASKGANLEATGTGFDTPLVAAARTGTVETVKALLEAKANPEVRTTRNYWTALTAAAYRGEVDIVNLLAPLSSGSLDEALQIASLQGKPAVVDALLRLGGDVFSRSKDNKTPLMYAAANGHQDVVRLLMLSGSNKLLIDNDRQTAADLAVTAGHPDVLKVLDDPKLVAVSAVTPTPDATAVAATGASADPAATGAAAAVGESDPAAPTDGTVAAGTAGSPVPGEVPTQQEAAVARATADGPVATDPEFTATVASTAPFKSPTGDDTPDAPAEAAVAQASTPSYPRLQGSRLAGLADGSTAALKESVRVRDFREGQLPIVLEEVPAVGGSARIRVLGRVSEAPEIVPAGGVIGDTGLELIGVERKFMNSKMGEGHQLDVSHAVVRDRATGQRHIVRKNQAVPSTQATALISAGSAGEVYEVQEGDEFTAGESEPARYKVIDVRPTQVVIENLETLETATLARTYAR